MSKKLHWVVHPIHNLSRIFSPLIIAALQLSYIGYIALKLQSFKEKIYLIEWIVP